MKYYYKRICCGEIMEDGIFFTKEELLDKIKKTDYTYSYFEVIYGTNITENLKKELFL